MSKAPAQNINRALAEREAEAKTIAASRLMATASNETKMLMLLHQRLVETMLYGEAKTPMPGTHHA